MLDIYAAVVALACNGAQSRMLLLRFRAIVLLTFQIKFSTYLLMQILLLLCQLLKIILFLSEMCYL